MRHAVDGKALPCLVTPVGRNIDSGARNLLYDQQLPKVDGTLFAGLPCRSQRSIWVQLAIVTSRSVKRLGVKRKYLSATMAEVLPLLLAPTKMVVLGSKSTCVDFSFRELLISTNLIRMFQT
jgi:hypothetical protein